MPSSAWVSSVPRTGSIALHEDLPLIASLPVCVQEMNLEVEEWLGGCLLLPRLPEYECTCEAVSLL